MRPDTVASGQTPAFLPRWVVPAAWATLVGTVVVAVVAGILGRWTPVSDQAMITALALDTWSTDPPLLGMPTSFSLRTGTPVRHPGPLPIWIMAGPARVLGAPGYGMVLGAAVIQVSALLALVWTTVRMRRPAAAAAVVLATALMVANGLGAHGVRDPLNPFLGVLTALAATVALWAFASGDRWALVVFVGAGSLAAQAHVTFLPYIGALVLVAVVATVWELTRRRPVIERRRLTRRVLPTAIGIGIVCWVGPIIDQLWQTGNLSALLSSGGEGDAAGWRYGVERLVDAVAPYPIWLRTSSAIPHQDPGVLRHLAAAAILGALVAAGIWAWRRRERTTCALAITALTACAAGVVVASLIPDDPTALANRGSRLLWWPIGAFTYLAVALAGTAAIRDRLPARVRALDAGDRRVRTVAALGTGAVVVASLFVMGPYDTTTQEGSVVFGAVRFHADAIEARTPPGGTVRLQAPNTTLNNYTLVQSLIAQLRLRGFEVDVDVADWWGVFSAYRADHPSDGEPADAVVWVQGDPQQPAAPTAFELVSSYDPATPPPGFERFADLRGTVFLTGGLPPSFVYLTTQDVPRLWEYP